MRKNGTHVGKQAPAYSSTILNDKSHISTIGGGTLTVPCMKILDSLL